MGIRGLTTYINDRSDYYLEPHELQNTHLIIDGWSLSSQLYCTITRSNCTFGGDYDKFSQIVTVFLEDLLRCKVMPIVLFDGGWENKKRATVFNRAREKLTVASNYGPLVQNKAKYFPLMMADVFRDVLVKLNIKFAMCPFEADECIAGVAKILGAPVLSYDSDFYIYGVMYIPFNTLDPYISKNKFGYAKRCKMYKIDKLLNKFRGLDASLLPLASILLGNDYIKRSTFKDFFSKLKLSKSKTRSEQQRRIQSTLNWLRSYSLNSAVAAVLKKLPRERREKVLHSIEIIVNGYSNLATYMLQPLGLTQDYASVIRENQTKIFKFQGNVNSLEDFEKEEENGEDEVADDDKEEEDEEEEDEVDEEFDFISNEKFAASAPNWFIENHLSGNFPTWFITMLTHKIHILVPQVEDFSQPSSHEISIPIITKLFSLLMSEERGEHTLELVTRENYKFTRRFIKVEESPVTLQDLRKMDVKEKKKIIDSILGIDDEDNLKGVPDNWRLYLASIIYWMRQEIQPVRSNIHLNCLLYSMLFAIIDEKIGFRRSTKMFEKKFRGKIEEITKRKRAQDDSVNDDCSLNEAVHLIDEDDCIMAAQFFISQFEMDERLRSLPRRFSIGIVHVFAQFQSCLRYFMHLNALLGHPYVHPCPGELFNGTLLYNLYNNFTKRTDVQNYIHAKLAKSPSFLRVFQGLYKIVGTILVNVKEEKTKCTKRKRIKSRKKETAEDEDDYVTAESEAEMPEKSQHFFDPRNPFSLLSVS